MPEDLATAPTAATAPQAPAAVLADRYEILGLLGAGGMGRVYRALDRTLDEVVALKLLRKELAEVPGMLDRFRQEVKVARRVTHANVVRTFDLGQHGDDHFLTMEYVDGRSLAMVLDGSPPSLDEALRIARGIADGLAAAHASAVLHRDLKPDNVLVGKSGRIAITDFGIARLAATPAVTGDRFIGTPAYMAPEQVEGQELGPAADVYAFGAILFELATGRRPFPGDDPFAVALARLRQAPPDPRSLRAVPDALAELVLRCLAREPQARPASGGQLATALAQIRSGDATLPAPLVPSVPAQKSRAVAILPLRATGDLAEVAEGLSEEIVDGLTMTRSLRVRPLASVRAAAKGDADARALGQQLGVDVVVEGSVRRRAAQVRITARAIGVADGFQLWASHLDVGPEGLLAAGDEVVRAIAGALVVDVEVPARAALDARIAERYLEAKARLRASWIDGRIQDVIASLEPLLAEAPDDPRLLATLAQARARVGFYGDAASLARAREHAERALRLAPDFGDAQMARAVVHIYAGEAPQAARMLRRTLDTVPGFALAQALLGGLLLEAGAVEHAVAHLEAAHAIDPTSALPELVRAYVYAGRRDAAEALLAGRDREIYVQAALARYAMWRGERRPITVEVPDDIQGMMRTYLLTAVQVAQTGTLRDEQVTGAVEGVAATNLRARAASSQFIAEFLAFTGHVDRALEVIALGVDAGLLDTLWMERCGVLAPLRDRPEFRALADQVAARARAVVDAVFAP